MQWTPLRVLAGVLWLGRYGGVVCEVDPDTVGGVTSEVEQGVDLREDAGRVAEVEVG